MNEDIIKIKEGKMPEALRALYNASQPVGLGMIEYEARDMTIAEARQQIDEGVAAWDYVKGRYMKVWICPGSRLFVGHYDKQLGFHRAASACLEFMEPMDNGAVPAVG